MARKTKADLTAEREAADAAFWAEQAATYPERLMALLERATKQNYEMEVRDAKFVLEDRDNRWESTVELTLTFSRASQDALNQLEWRLEAKEEAEQKEQYRAQVRVAALNKLSQEEREILGI